jgi:ATP-binding cassette subfamily F protein 3
MLRLNNVSLLRDGQKDYLLQEANWELVAGQKIGLLGYNGAGKTSLLMAIGGTLEPESGSIERHYQGLFVLEQEDQAEGAMPGLEYLLSVDAALLLQYRNLKQMEAQGLPDPLAYADASQSFLEAGGFERLNQIERLAVKFGFDPAVLARPVQSLSGGERRLLRLASGFVQHHDLYLLDEPTNYLDHSASQRLVRALLRSEATLLMVSHDRWFLDQVAGYILELDRQKLRLFSGNYSIFAATKAQELAEAVRKKEKLEREIEQLKKIERTYKTWGKDREADKYRPTEGKKDKGYIGTKAAKLQGRAVQAKERMQGRIEQLQEERPWIEKQYEVKLEPTEPRQGWSLLVQGLSHAWGVRVLWQDLNVRLDWGEKVLLSGENGSGKSTLLKLLMNQLEPQAGQIIWAPRIRIGYLPQLSEGFGLASEVQQLFAREEHLEAQTLLGCFKVKGEAFFRPLDSLSEGQKRKVALVRLMLDKPNLLILDEPTTHLDYQSVEMLEQMLLQWNGTVLFASHDRYLSSRVAGRVIELG